MHKALMSGQQFQRDAVQRRAASAGLATLKAFAAQDLVRQRRQVFRTWIGKLENAHAVAQRCR